IASIVLLSLIPEKKPRYVLPALIPLALNTSFYIDYLFRKFRVLPLRESWIVYLNHGLIALIGVAFPFVGYFILDLEGSDWIWYIASSIVLFAIGLTMFYYLGRRDYPKLF